MFVFSHQCHFSIPLFYLNINYMAPLPALVPTTPILYPHVWKPFPFSRSGRLHLCAFFPLPFVICCLGKFTSGGKIGSCQTAELIFLSKFCLGRGEPEGEGRAQVRLGERKLVLFSRAGGSR